MEHRITVLSNLKLFIYSHVGYDYVDLPYTVAITSLYYACLSFYYVFVCHVIQSWCNCIVTLPYPQFSFDHVHLISDCTTTLFGWMHFPFGSVKKTFEGCFSFYTIFNWYIFYQFPLFQLHTFYSYNFDLHTFFHLYTLNSYSFYSYSF